MKIGIALGGGGAKGFAHIGVLNTLEKAGIEFSAVSGTSIGALVGAFCAAGEIKQLEQASKRIKFRDVPILLSPTISKEGLFSGRKVLNFLNEFLKERRIEELKKDYAAVCVDLNRFEIVTFDKGDLILAVRASMAIPGIFTPVVYKKKLLVDGGTLEPLPVRAAREIGSDFVVAVDLISGSLSQSADQEYPNDSELDKGSSGVSSISHYIRSITDSSSVKRLMGGKERMRLGNRSFINIIQRTLLLNQSRLISYGLMEWPADFIIKPELSGVGVLDFHHAKRTIEIGKEATESILPELKRLMNKRLAKKDKIK